MTRRAKALLMGIIAVIVVVILIAAYFASQPKIKWWKPEKEMKKPDVDFDGLNSVVSFIREEGNKSLHLYAGNTTQDKNFRVSVYLHVKSYWTDEVRANLTAWVERVSGDYVLQKLVISYQYGSEKEYEYTGISYVDTYVFRGANLWYDRSPSTYPNSHDTMMWDEWKYGHKLVGVNKDKKDADFYGVSFAIEIKLFDSLSLNLTHTIIFTVTAYYGHPSLLRWTDMHEVKTQVVLKIVVGGEKE
mgnify:CR=1 FL=1